jgi:hypothetical protein
MTYSSRIQAALAAVPSSVKDQNFGPWKLFRHAMPHHMIGEALGRDEFTILMRYVKPQKVDWDNLHLVREDGTIPDIVMEDTPMELQKHLPIWMKGKGHVLKTGLGLGCVVRGLLSKEDVKHITVIEIDADIIRVIGEEFKANPRVTIHHADALEFDYSTLPHIDYAWHDIWVPENSGLQKLHGKLIEKCLNKNTTQGAWQSPRATKRMLRQEMKWIG